MQNVDNIFEIATFTPNLTFDFYMETKTTCVAYGTHIIPKLGK